MLNGIHKDIDINTEKKILDFYNLDNGWSYGRGVKFSEKTINLAIYINSLMENFGLPETNAFPGESGEILVTAYSGNLCFEVFVYESEKFDLIIDKSEQEIFRKEGVDLGYLLHNMRDFIISPV